VRWLVVYGKSVGRWIHTFSWCPVLVAVAFCRSKAEMNPRETAATRRLHNGYYNKRQAISIENIFRNDKLY